MKKQNESLKLFNLSFIPGVEAISGQNITNEFRRHIHKTYIIGMVEQGMRIMDHPGGVVRVSENEIFIINPGQVHSCTSPGPFGHSYRLLSITLQAFQIIASQISEKPETRPWFEKNHHKNERLSEKFIQLFGGIEAQESDIHVESLVYSFLVHLLIFYSKSSPLVSPIGEQKEGEQKEGEQKESIQQVCQYISQNYTANLSLKKLAAIACLSPFHFQREFKKHMGITPQEYLSDFRIRESKIRLLKSGDIAAIALGLGFVDQSHFSRVFKKTVGIPPGKFCKINRIVN